MATSASEQESEGATGAAGAPPSDVAGVLKRNQACLACRRRKLKCDAVRPHCSTCVRSHKHLMRTASHTHHVLSCEYDYADEPAAASGSVHHNESSARRDTIDGASSDDTQQRDAPAAGSSAKKRKASTTANGGPSRKRTSEANNNSNNSKIREEEDRLREKIRELEAQLASRQGKSDPNGSTGTSVFSGGLPDGRAWSSNAGPSISNVEAAPSPTAFLDMLSAAAAAKPPQHSEANSFPYSMANGLRDGASEATMMTGATGVVWPGGTSRDTITTSIGFTPLFSFGDSDIAAPPQQQREAGITELLDSKASSDRPTPGLHIGSSGSSAGHSTGLTPFTVPDQSPAPALSPSGVFNFTPGPSGPTAASPRDALPFRGPLWRGVDTVESVLNVANGFADTSRSAEIGNPPEPFQSMDDLPQLDDATQQQLLLDLFWPGWPVHLPEPHIVNALVDAFFDLVPALPRMLHRPRLLARLALPPTHANFPHPSLIHAICALASNWCAPSVYERSKAAKALDAKGRPMSFGLRQASLAKEAAHDGLNTGNRMFDVVRAMMVLSRIFIDDTRMLECWAFNGLVARMILPLGLNVRSAELSLKSVMLPPPTDALEREERRAAMWFAMYHDTIASAASGWGTSISLEELTIPLPVSMRDFEAGLDTMESNSQDLESPDLFTRHPIPDPFVMVIKASALLNRVNRFARKWKNRHLRHNDDFDGMERPEFRELANAIACFQMSFPANLRNCIKRDVKRRPDVDLITAHLIPHAATICLYEPFADITDPQDLPARRLVTAAQAIGSIVQQLVSDAQDSSFTSMMHSSASICLVTAARTQLLFYRHALNVKDQVSADMYRADIELLRMALSQYGQKFKIGHHHAQLVEYFIDRAANPSFEKLQAHYPDHPRTGAPELRPDSDLGLCVSNALNIKRGFWRIVGAPPPPPASAGVSPFESTPGSTGNAPSARSRSSFDACYSTGASGATGATTFASVTRVGSDSPQIIADTSAQAPPPSGIDSVKKQATVIGPHGDAGGSLRWPVPIWRLEDGVLVPTDLAPTSKAPPPKSSSPLDSYSFSGSAAKWPGFEDTMKGIGTGGPPVPP